jgi:hypothetical protein
MGESGDVPVTLDPSALRYDGEDVIERLDLDGARIAVTSHRVLVVTPDGPGSRFRSVYRPNVVGVGGGVRADRGAGRRALQAGAYAVLLSAAGAIIDLDGLVGGVNVTGTEELGGVTSLIQQMLDLLLLVDDLFVGVGLLAGAVAVAFAGLYLWRRNEEFRIRVAGGDPIALPSQEREEVLADRLRAAIGGEAGQ